MIRRATIFLLATIICVSACGCQNQSGENDIQTAEPSEEVQEEIQYKKVTINGIDIEVPETWKGQPSNKEETRMFEVVEEENSAGVFAVIVQGGVPEDQIRSFSEYCVGIFGDSIKVNTVEYSLNKSKDVCTFEGNNIQVGEDEYFVMGKTMLVQSKMVFTLLMANIDYTENLEVEYAHIVSSLS